jgi:hypothetical protein
MSLESNKLEASFLMTFPLELKNFSTMRHKDFLERAPINTTPTSTNSVDL